MKKITFGTILFFLLFLSVHGQTSKKTYKRLTDSIFNIGDVIIAPEISFDLSKCSVWPGSEDSVKIVADFLTKHPTFKVELGLYCDSRGDKEKNVLISECRAKELLLYLNEVNGIPKDRMTAKGYGSTDLIIGDAQIKKTIDKAEKEKLHQKNRRVEIKILGT